MYRLPFIGKIVGKMLNKQIQSSDSVGKNNKDEPKGDEAKSNYSHVMGPITESLYRR